MKGMFILGQLYLAYLADSPFFSDSLIWANSFLAITQLNSSAQIIHSHSRLLVANGVKTKIFYGFL
jgi:hypothetical protein